jgi:8-oxo-dGTP pyrophosphatase MutT (NUDIX family)
MERGESKEESAIREVEEECGISGLKIIKELPTVYHTYTLQGKRILKVTYWFEMTTDFDGELKPQTEEDITDVKWVEDVNEVLANTYESLDEMLRGLILK